MSNRQQTSDFHVNAPNRLKTAFKKAGSFSRLARTLELNVRYVHDLLKHGIEPVNPEIRLKLYLPIKSFNDLPLGDKRFRHIRWWFGLTKAQRNVWILFAHTYKKENSHARHDS
jgi:hypothetical protein